MTRILRDIARAFASYRRWHAGLLRRKAVPGAVARPATAHRTSGRPAAHAEVIDLSRARRVRCISEPCTNTRLVIARLRAERRAHGPVPQFGSSR